MKIQNIAFIVFGAALVVISYIPQLIGDVSWQVNVGVHFLAFVGMIVAGESGLNALGDRGIFNRIIPIRKSLELLVILGVSAYLLELLVGILAKGWLLPNVPHDIYFLLVIPYFGLYLITLVVLFRLIEIVLGKLSNSRQVQSSGAKLGRSAKLLLIVAIILTILPLILILSAYLQNSIQIGLTNYVPSGFINTYWYLFTSGVGLIIASEIFGQMLGMLTPIRSALAGNYSKLFATLILSTLLAYQMEAWNLIPGVWVYPLIPEYNPELLDISIWIFVGWFLQFWPLMFVYELWEMKRLK